MNDQNLDEILKRGAAASETVSPELLDRIAASMGPSLKPVRPLAPLWWMEGCLIASAVAVACIGAAKMGFFGFLKLNVSGRVIIFS
ncbi:MAG TPA: hypothetical protein VHS08_02090, partial [Candidatus Acidoferrales bacterium]|nr:hypothetical protein [Candidatus Acidoferrales bacterium]